MFAAFLHLNKDRPELCLGDPRAIPLVKNKIWLKSDIYLDINIQNLNDCSVLNEADQKCNNLRKEFNICGNILWSQSHVCVLSTKLESGHG